MEAFLDEHGSEDMVQMWQEDPNQDEFMKLIPSKTKKTSSPKDPNKPKRGKSSYLFFCADNRAQVKEEMGDEAKATEVTSELGRRWTALKESTTSKDKKKLTEYELEASKDKERYLSDMVDYEPPSDEEIENAKSKKSKKSKKSISKKDKDPDKPKRGKSAYLFFCADNRAQVKEDLGADSKGSDVLTELGRLWNELKESTTAKDKKKLKEYELDASKDKERYLRDMVDYEPPSDEEAPKKSPKKKVTVEEASDEEASDEEASDEEAPKK
jgi:hypothetical protein